MIIEIISVILFLSFIAYLIIDEKKYKKGKVPFSKRLIKWNEKQV